MQYKSKQRTKTFCHTLHLNALWAPLAKAIIAMRTVGLSAQSAQSAHQLHGMVPQLSATLSLHNWRQGPCRSQLAVTIISVVHRLRSPAASAHARGCVDGCGRAVAWRECRPVFPAHEGPPVPELCLRLDRRISPCPGVRRRMWACSGPPGRRAGAPCAVGGYGNQHINMLDMRLITRKDQYVFRPLPTCTLTMHAFICSQAECQHPCHGTTGGCCRLGSMAHATSMPNRQEASKARWLAHPNQTRYVSVLGRLDHLLYVRGMRGCRVR